MVVETDSVRVGEARLMDGYTDGWMNEGAFSNVAAVGGREKIVCICI